MDMQGSNVVIVDFRPDASVTFTVGEAVRPYHALSFVEGDNLWAPARTGSHATDCDLGRRYADELLRHIERHECPPLLGYVCRAMSAEIWGGVEVGFFQALAEATTHND